MNTLDVPGARLYYETHGSGPLLVMIPGAGGVADSFRTVAGQLAERYTVLIYDRRGFSRSRLNGEQDYDHRLSTDADDVRRLVEHAGGGPATVFGASSGATVALTVLTRHPSVVRTLIPYEPPLMRLLPDGRKWLDFFTELYEEYRESGPWPAQERVRERCFPPADLAVMAHAPRNDANAVHWFEHELRQYPPVELDLDALAQHAGRILPAVGIDGRGYPCHDATVELAARLARPVTGLPGGHVGFLAHPAEFARELTRALSTSDATTAQARRTGRGGRPGSMTAGEWDESYTDTPHWDLGRPQTTFRALADEGAIQGRVLDVGCGTGEHVLMAAALGLDATGIDLAPAALRAAEAKARARGLTARFLRWDARKLDELGESFDTVLDCGLFHIFEDADRAAYLASVRSVLPAGGRYLILCFSDRQPGDQGPRHHPARHRVHLQRRLAHRRGGPYDAGRPSGHRRPRRLADRRHPDLSPADRRSVLMPHAEARIQAGDPSRYLVHLCRHAEKFGEALRRGHLRFGHSGWRPDHSGAERPEVLGVEYTGSTGTLRLTCGTCTMYVEGDTLTLYAEAAGEDDLKRLQDIVTADLERFGQRDDLKVTWSEPETSPPSTRRPDGGD